MNFTAQYNHPNWQKKRLEILNRDNWRCLHCGDTETQLQVHHKKYIWNKKVWDYPNDNFETLCSTCHEKETKRIKLAKTMSKYSKNKTFKTKVDKLYNKYDRRK